MSLIPVNGVLSYNVNRVLFQCILHKAKELDQKLLCVIYRHSNQSTLLVGQHISHRFSHSTVSPLVGLGVQRGILPKLKTTQHDMIHQVCEIFCLQSYCGQFSGFQARLKESCFGNRCL